MLLLLYHLYICIKHNLITKLSQAPFIMHDFCLADMGLSIKGEQVEVGGGGGQGDVKARTLQLDWMGW